MSVTPSVLLVEFVNSVRFAAVKSVSFSFIVGALEAQGLPVRWLCFATDEQPETPHPFLVDLGSSARERLLEIAAADSSTHLLLAEQPAPALVRFLADRLPAAQWAALGSSEAYLRAFERRWLEEWLAVEIEGDELLLPDVVAPRYCAEAMDQSLVEHPPPTTVTAGAHCLYSAPLRRNPFYRELDLSQLPRDHGCAFCPGFADNRYPYRTSAVELVLRQARAVAQAPSTAHDPTLLMIQSARAFAGIATLFERLAEERLPPSRFFFSCRADELLAMTSTMEGVLRAARELGHQVYIGSLGAESFSAQENLRLNTGVSVDDLRAVRRQLAAWEAEFPEQFFFSASGGFGYILFTPWTTLADLRINLEVARELAIREVPFLLTRRLMLLPRSATYALARKDGLLAAAGSPEEERFGWLARYCDPGSQFWPDDVDTPWFFRDPRVNAVWAITVRMAGPREAVPDDPYQPRILEALGPRGGDEALLDCFGLLLDLAEAAEGPMEVEGLLEAFAARLASTPVVSRTPDGVGPRWDQAAAVAARARVGLQKLERHPEDPLGGFRLEAVEVERRRVILEFARRDGPSQRVRLFLEPDTYGGPCRVRRGGIAFSYCESTPLDTEKTERPTPGRSGRRPEEVAAPGAASPAGRRAASCATATGTGSAAR